MAAKTIKPQLLWETMFWVLYEHSQKSHKEKSERPIRGFQKGDGKLTQEAIKTIRMHWYHERKREEPSFEKVKNDAIESLTKKYAWSTETRNYISSCATTYISWDYHGQSEVSKRKLTIISAYARAFFDPQNLMEEIRA